MDGRTWIEQLPDELSGQRAILTGLLDWSRATQIVRCLAVACSVGRGAGDRFSDLDTGMAVAARDFDAAVAKVHRAVDGLSELVESYHHKLPGLTIPHERIFAQYANRCQVDLVVIPATEFYGAVKDEVMLFDPDGLRQARFEQSPVTPHQVREWAFNGWACLADVGKYLRRGSSWEALGQLNQARYELWRLLAVECGVPNPQYGITSLLDFAPDRVPAEVAGTVADLDIARLLTAAADLARQLTQAGDRLDADLRAALPVAMADYVTADLAAIPN